MKIRGRSHNTKLTILRCYIQWNFVHSLFCSHHLSLVLKCFCRPSRPRTFKQSLPVSSSAQALTITTLLSVSVDLSLLNSSRNGITLLSVMGFCQHHIFKLFTFYKCFGVIYFFLFVVFVYICLIINEMELLLSCSGMSDSL